MRKSLFPFDGNEKNIKLLRTFLWASEIFQKVGDMSWSGWRGGVVGMFMGWSGGGVIGMIYGLVCLTNNLCFFLMTRSGSHDHKCQRCQILLLPVLMIFSIPN